MADETNKPLSTLPAEAMTAAKSLGTTIAPLVKKYSYMSAEVANGLTTENVRLYDDLEKLLEESRRNLNNAEAASFNAIANGSVNKAEFEQRMNNIALDRNDPDVGVVTRDAFLRENQTTASRTVGFVRELSQKMGVQPPLIETRLDYAPIEHTWNAEGQRYVNLPNSKMRTLTDEELKFVAAHEIAHGLLNHTADTGRKSHLQEFAADDTALLATGNLDAAISAISKFATVENQPNAPATKTHPSLAARIQHLREIAEQELQKPMATPASTDKDTLKLPPR